MRAARVRARQSTPRALLLTMTGRQMDVWNSGMPSTLPNSADAGVAASFSAKTGCSLRRTQPTMPLPRGRQPEDPSARSRGEDSASTQYRSPAGSMEAKAQYSKPVASRMVSR